MKVSYLAARPTLRYLPSWMPVANARLGQTYRFPRNDRSAEHTNWFSLVFYGDSAILAMELEKGTNLYVEGTFDQRPEVSVPQVLCHWRRGARRACSALAAPSSCKRGRQRWRSISRNPSKSRHLAPTNYANESAAPYSGPVCWPRPSLSDSWQVGFPESVSISLPPCRAAFTSSAIRPTQILWSSARKVHQPPSPSAVNLFSSPRRVCGRPGRGDRRWNSSQWTATSPQCGTIPRPLATSPGPVALWHLQS